MADFDDFALACQKASKDLRRIPRDLRRELSTEVKGKVAAPLAAKVGAAARGPWARALSAAPKARAGADPTIVIGGSRKVVSGGASARQLVFGAEFGGGKRYTAVPARPRRRGYKRASTNQFHRNQTPFVFPTIGREGGWVLDQFADIVDDVLKGGGFDG